MVNAAAYMMAVWLLAAQTGANLGRSNLSVQFSNSRLSIRAVNVPLRVLAEEISKKSGIIVEIKDAKAAEQPMTVDLVQLAPMVAFEQLLRGLNFVTFHDTARLSRVIVVSFGTASPDPASSKIPQPQREARSAPSAEADFDELVTRNRDEGLKAIAQALKGNNRTDKMSAVEALENVGAADDPEIIRLLGEALSDSDRAVKKAALEALAQKEGPAVVPLLRTALQDSNPSIRVDALDALAEKGDLNLVKSALSDPNKEVRERAQELLEIEADQEKAKYERSRRTGAPVLPRQRPR